MPCLLMRTAEMGEILVVNVQRAKAVILVVEGSSQRVYKREYLRAEKRSGHVKQNVVGSIKV